jgi:hypothetical protein
MKRLAMPAGISPQQLPGSAWQDSGHRIADATSTWNSRQGAWKTLISSSNYFMDRRRTYG